VTRLMDRDTARARMARRAFPIHAYVGPNGSGKSALMVYDTITSLQWGRPVLSTVRLLDFTNPRLCPGGALCDNPAGHEREVTRVTVVPDPETGHPVAIRVPTGRWEVHKAHHPLYVRFTDYQQLLDWYDGDVLMDEVTGVASSRDSMSGMPTQVVNLLVQMRRRNVVLRWSAPAWGRADKVIREVSQAATLTVPYKRVLGVPLSKKKPAVEGEPPRLWLEHRLFRARTFDAQLVDEFEARRALDVKPMVQAWYWGPGAAMFDAYDTYDNVTALGWANEAGMCMNCGGKRKTPTCGCDDHVKVATPRPRLQDASL
jgi:hypothetical protein